MYLTNYITISKCLTDIGELSVRTKAVEVSEFSGVSGALQTTVRRISK